MLHALTTDQHPGCEDTVPVTLMVLTKQPTPQPGDIAVASVTYVPGPRQPQTDAEYAETLRLCDELCE